VEPALDRFVTISGCSGGGKSTLLAALARLGHSVVEEPGRRIVAEELSATGAALPWVDGTAFAKRAIAMSLADRAAAAGTLGWVFFDRGLIDAAAALEHLTSEPAISTLGRAHRYHRRVFMAPPWAEIYSQDPERHHGFDEAKAEYERLLEAYPALGYEIYLLPKVSVSDRVDYILAMLGKA
jgi:predicted ATPase